jgi:hypothetical protein
MAQTICLQQDTVFLQCTDFKIIANDKYSLDIEIIQKSKLKEIANSKEPIFCFYLDEKKYIAKGNEILKSSVPEKCDYFYSLGVKNEVMLRNSSTLHFIKVCNACHSQTVMQTDTYILPVDYIEHIDIDKSTIKLNSTGLKEIKLIDFKEYNYFTIEKCKFKAMVLSFISSLRLPEPLVYLIDSPLIDKGIIILEIDHLDTKEKRKCKEELKVLMAQTTCLQQDTIFLYCNDFKILTQTEYHLDIEIIQESKIKEIASKKKPIFCFYIEENG